LITKFAARIGHRIEAVGRATMERLRNYSWPGNVRELENILERAIILASGPILEIDAEVFAGSSSTTAASASRDLESVERDHILAALKESDWVIEGQKGAARILNLHPNTLRSRLKKMGITRSSHEAATHDPS
jgi:DNA-binding NtrC family response regulator